MDTASTRRLDTHVFLFRGRGGKRDGSRRPRLQHPDWLPELHHRARKEEVHHLKPDAHRLLTSASPVITTGLGRPLQQKQEALHSTGRDPSHSAP
ncbi:hypothetical protein PAMP_015183 [Pampus punctatissimus]